MCNWFSRGFRVASGCGYASFGLVWDWLSGVAPKLAQADAKANGPKARLLHSSQTVGPCLSVDLRGLTKIGLRFGWV